MTGGWIDAGEVCVGDKLRGEAVAGGEGWATVSGIMHARGGADLVLVTEGGDAFPQTAGVDLVYVAVVGDRTVHAADDGVGEFATSRRPYVGHGPDGCRRSAAIDREQADVLPVGDPRRATLLASAYAWETQAVAGDPA